MTVARRDPNADSRQANGETKSEENKRTRGNTKHSRTKPRTKLNKVQERQAETLTIRQPNTGS